VVLAEHVLPHPMLVVVVIVSVQVVSMLGVWHWSSAYITMRRGRSGDISSHIENYY
jgi:hypothetical protein